MKKLSLNILLIFFGLFLSFSTILLFEIVLQSIPEKPFSIPVVKALETNERNRIKELTGEKIEKLELSKMPDRFKKIREAYPISSFDEGFQNLQVKYSELPGLKNYAVRATLPSTKELIHEEEYNFDSLDRRITPGSPQKPNKEIMLIGCSYTYGDGLNENETKAFFLQKNYTKTQVHTYANRGWGINDHLAAITQMREYNLNPYKNFNSKKKIAVYFYYEFQLPRSICPLSCYKKEKSWMMDGANWNINESKNIFLGTYRETRKYKTLIGSVADSAIVKKFKLEFPTRHSSINLNSFNNQMIDFHSELAKRVELDDFYIAFDENITLAGLASLKKLESHGIKLIDMSGFSMQALTNGKDLIPFDGHPSPQSNYVISKILFYQLKKDHPEYF